MTRFAVVCAAGIGDALILEIAAHGLRKAGHEVVTVSDWLGGFGQWLPEAKCCKWEGAEDVEAVLVQHDNTERARAILRMRPEKEVYCFYTNYRESKHGPLKKGEDFAFDENCSMVANVKRGMKEIFGIDVEKGDNGLRPPEGVMYRRHAKRVAIHPTSTMASKNWPRKKFLEVAEWLKGEGYDPVFVTAPGEREEWGSANLPTLEDLASFLYESGGFVGNDSGPGHLASYFGLPYLIIGQQERQMRLWRPGWHPGAILTAPSWIPNWKGLRIRDEKWQWFVSTKNVIKMLQKRVLRNVILN